MDKSFFEKFSLVLRLALERGLVSFDGHDVKYDYSPINVFRKLKGNSVQDDDFKSQAELYGEGLLSRWPNNSNAEMDIGNYSCSFFDNLENLKKLFSHKRNYTFAKGILKKEHGAICYESGGHIHCWCYENSNIKESFEVII